MDKFLLFIGLVVFDIGCISNKRITYLQNLPENTPIELNEFIPFAEVEYEYILQPFDIVNIQFASSDEELVEVFSFRDSQTVSGVRNGGAGGQGSDPFYFSGYSIDKEGMVEVPKLGKINIAGMTEEAKSIRSTLMTGLFLQAHFILSSLMIFCTWSR